jgi:hypothetical protein
MKAQYKRQDDLAQQTQRAEIYDLQESDPAQAQRAAFVAGVDLPQQKFEPFYDLDLNRIVSYDINDPATQRKMSSGDIVQSTKVGENPIEQEWEAEDGSTMRTNTQTGVTRKLVGENWRVVYDPEEERPQLRQPSRQTEEGLPTASRQDIFTLPSDAETSRAQQIMAIDPTGTVTGPVPAITRGLARVPIVGDILSERAGGFAQEEIAGKRFINRLNLNLRAEAARILQEEGRLQSMIIEMVKEEPVNYGLLGTPDEFAENMASIRQESINAYNNALADATSVTVSQKRRLAANEYLTTFVPLINDMTTVVLSHQARKTNVPTVSLKEDGTFDVNTSQQRKVQELSIDELRTISSAYIAGEINLDNSQRQILADMLALYSFELAQQRGRSGR